MNLFKKNDFLVDGSIYLGPSCSDVLCSADRNGHMDSVRDNITTLLCANKNNEPLQNMTVYRVETFFYLLEGVTNVLFCFFMLLTFRFFLKFLWKR
jgi:hypothetical protein